MILFQLKSMASRFDI